MVGFVCFPKVLVINKGKETKQSKGIGKIGHFANWFANSEKQHYCSFLLSYGLHRKNTVSSSGKNIADSPKLF